MQTFVIYKIASALSLEIIDYTSDTSGIQANNTKTIATRNITN